MPGDTTPIRFARRATDTRLALPSRPSPVPCVKPRQVSDKLRFRALDTDGGTVRASGTIPRHPIPRWFRYSPNGGSCLSVELWSDVANKLLPRVFQTLLEPDEKATLLRMPFGHNGGHPPLAPESPTTMSGSDAGAEPSSHALVNSFVILRISCKKRVTASVCSGWLSEKSSAKSTEDKRQRRMSQNDGLSSVDFITPSLRTIRCQPIPCFFCISRAIRRYSVLRRNLAIVRTVWTIVDAELFCVTNSPQRANLAVPSATPTAGSVQNWPISLAPLLVPFVPTLQGSHSQEHTSCTTSTSLV